MRREYIVVGGFDVTVRNTAIPFSGELQYVGPGEEGSRIET